MLLTLRSLKVLQGPLQQSFTKELLSDKEGICVSQETDFGSVAVGKKVCIKIVVENKGEISEKLCRCHMTASSSQIRIKSITAQTVRFR